MALKCKACGRNLSEALGIMLPQEIMEAHTKAHQRDQFRAAGVEVAILAERIQQFKEKFPKGSEKEKDLAIILSNCQSLQSYIDRAADLEWVSYEMKAG